MNSKQHSFKNALCCQTAGLLVCSKEGWKAVHSVSRLLSRTNFLFLSETDTVTRVCLGFLSYLLAGGQTGGFPHFAVFIFSFM